MNSSTQSFERSVNEPFKKYRILLTGDEGFIASKVKEKLRQMGHDVIGYDIASGYDIMNLAQVEQAVKNVDVVYHLAAQADMTQMTDLEGGRIGTDLNVQGTHNIAYACAKYKKWLIYGSTVCVYGNVTDHPESEDTTLPNPSELYSCAKYAGEWIVRGYGLNYDMEWTSLRFATIYGEGMREALGLYVFFKQAMEGKPITVHGDGNQVRTLTYIYDLVDGIVAPLAHPEKAKGNIINLTNNTGVSAIKMAQDVKKLTGSASEIVFIEQRKNQTLTEDFDVSKAKNLLDWESNTPWEVGLKNTYEWMKTQVYESPENNNESAPDIKPASSTSEVDGKNTTQPEQSDERKEPTDSVEQEETDITSEINNTEPVAPEPNEEKEEIINNIID